MKVLFADVL